MPTYEYLCTECDNQFEIWQMVGEEPPECPSCTGTTRKVFSPVRIIFKGSGFYATDNRSEKTPPAPCNGDAKKGESCATCPVAQDSKS